jgi:branched-chain amino acid transport system substrate-binding protein
MATLSVGAALSQSGMYALQGQQALQGLRLWVAETNAQGGLYVPERRRAVPLRLIAYDDCSRHAVLERLITQLIRSDGVDFLVGPYSSGLVSAAAAIAEAHQKVLWNHGGSSDAIMDRGCRWSVHLPTPASHYFAGLFPWLLRGTVGMGRVAIVQRRRGSFSAQVADGAQQHAEHNGFAVLPRYFYPDEPAQLWSLAAAVAEAAPAVLIAVGRYEDDVALVRALADTPWKDRLIAAVAAPMQAFGEDLHMLAEGCIGPSQWEPATALVPDVGVSSAAFVETFRRAFGQVPDYPAAQAYAAGLILQQCVLRAGTCVDVDLRMAASRLICRTFYGEFRLDPETGRQVGHQAVLVQWQGARKQVIWPG